MRRGSKRQREAAAGALRQHDAQVLDKDVERRVRRGVVVQHLRHAIHKHPAGARGRGDDLEQLPRVEACTRAQRHRFGGCGNVHASKKLVDHLHAAPGARGAVDAEQGTGRLGRHGRQHACRTRATLLGAGGHNGEGAGGRARHPARHGRIHKLQPTSHRRQLRGHALCGAGRHRGAQHHHRALRQPGRCLRDHRLRLLCTDYHQHQVRGARRGLHHAGGGLPARGGEALQRGRPHVEGAHGQAGAPQDGGHPGAHRAQPHEADRASHRGAFGYRDG